MSFASRFKLSAMMFLQFMLVAAFWVQLSSYLDNMKVSGLMFSLIMSTMAIGSIFSPLVGMFADRVANSEKVLAILNFFVAILLLATFFTSNPILIFIFLMLAMCAYMPTWGLTSSIAMTNSTPEAFPYIRVFGSLGWVCAAVFALGAKAIFDIHSARMRCRSCVSSRGVLALFARDSPESEGRADVDYRRSRFARIRNA